MFLKMCFQERLRSQKITLLSSERYALSAVADDTILRSGPTRFSCLKKRKIPMPNVEQLGANSGPNRNKYLIKLEQHILFWEACSMESPNRPFVAGQKRNLAVESRVI